MIKGIYSISAPRYSGCVIYLISSRACSQDIRVLRNPETAYLKRGTGGRSSFNGNVATIFGATGFFGQYLCHELGRRGTQLIIPHRCDPDEYTVKRLKLCGDLGQVLFQEFDLRDPLSIRKAVKYSNIVINLIGRDFETANFKYNDVHVKGAREIAKACREFNVERLIHFSALNVTENPQRYFIKKLNFLPSKLKGEQAVMEEFPDATIFRPSAIYGFHDNFIWPLCTRFRCWDYSVPLYRLGKETVRQPVWAADVATGVLNALNNYETRGKIYQAVGPERFYLHDIVIFCSQTLQRHIFTDKLVHNIYADPYLLAKILWLRYGVGFFQHYPLYGLSFEQIERESVTDIVDTNLPTLLDLGVKLSKMEDRVPALILKSFKANNLYVRSYDEHLPADSLSAKAILAYS